MARGKQKRALCLVLPAKKRNFNPLHLDSTHLLTRLNAVLQRRPAYYATLNPPATGRCICGVSSASTTFPHC